MTYTELAAQISNIKYAPYVAGENPKIEFTINNKQILIKEPRDVCLVGFAGAALWIAKNYSILLLALI